MRRTLFLWVVAGAMTALATVTCGTDENSTGGTDPCPQGICATSSSSAGGSGGTGGSGTSTGGNSSSSSGPGSGGGSGCVEAWICSPWQTNGMDDNGTRTCTDLNNCGTTNGKPVESAALPALDLDYYKCKVEPIFDRGCAQLACHGTETGRALRVYARGRHRNPGEIYIETGCLNPGKMVPSESCEGGIECACWTNPHTALEWRKNFDAARGFALDAKGNPIPAGSVDTSELIAQPIVGGKAHAGIKLFKSGDQDHQTLQSWLTGQKLGMTCTTDN